MADTEIEELQLALEGEILGLDMDELRDLAPKLDVAVEGLRKLQISKEIRKKIDSDVEGCDENSAKRQMLQGLLKAVAGDPPPLEGEEITEKPSVKFVEKPATDKSTEKPTNEKTTEKPANEKPVDISKVFMRRELKIHGQIVGDQKDGLSFVSLARQMDAAAKVGYTESEDAGEQDNPTLDEADLHVPSQENADEVNAEALEGQPHRPVRNRHPPAVLSYPTLGNPSYYGPYASGIQASNGMFMQQPQMYWPPQQWMFPPFQYQPTRMNYWTPQHMT